jgi:hypothetical protein
VDGITEMRSEHRTISALLEKLSTSRSRSLRQRKKLLRDVAETLARHLDLEEQVLFPLAQQEASAKDAVLKALEQHKILKNLLHEISGTEPSEERFSPLVQVIGDVLSSHVREEQVSVYSPLRQAMTSAQRRALGERIQQGREALANPKDYLRSD